MAVGHLDCRYEVTLLGFHHVPEANCYDFSESERCVRGGAGDRAEQGTGRSLEAVGNRGGSCMCPAAVAVLGVVLVEGYGAVADATARGGWNEKLLQLGGIVISFSRGEGGRT